MKTQASEVIDMFNSNDAAVKAFERWKCNPIRRGVPEVALKHTVHYAYEVAPQKIVQLRDKILDHSNEFLTGSRLYDKSHEKDLLHPLKSLKAFYCQHPEAEDWSPPMSFNLAFHTLLEARKGELFTYPEFRIACENIDPMQSLLWDHAISLKKEMKGSLSPGRYKWFLDSMQWRMGCAYYSFLKELYVLGVARERGVDAKMHPLADTLFRTDIWAGGGRAIAMFVPNKKYNGEKGRKRPMEEFLPTAYPKRSEIELDIPREFGTVDLPVDSVVDRAVKALAG